MYGYPANTLPAMRLATQITIALGTFALAAAVAGVAGAANFGTALAFGQIAFALAAALLIIRA